MWGAVLQQKASPGEDWRLLGFFSAKLKTAQLAYSAFDRELFGILAGIHHFRHHLESRNFTVWTDHKLFLKIFLLGFIILFIQYYSVICRPSDHTVGRPQAKIRTRVGRPRGRDTTPRLPHLLKP